MIYQDQSPILNNFMDFFIILQIQTDYSIWNVQNKICHKSCYNPIFPFISLPKNVNHKTIFDRPLSLGDGDLNSTTRCICKIVWFRLEPPRLG